MVIESELKNVWMALWPILRQRFFVIYFSFLESWMVRYSCDVAMLGWLVRNISGQEYSIPRHPKHNSFFRTKSIQSFNFIFLNFWQLANGWFWVHRIHLRITKVFTPPFGVWEPSWVRKLLEFSFLLQFREFCSLVSYFLSPFLSSLIAYGEKTGFVANSASAFTNSTKSWNLTIFPFVRISLAHRHHLGMAKLGSFEQIFFKISSLFNTSIYSIVFIASSVWTRKSESLWINTISRVFNRTPAR